MAQISTDAQAFDEYKARVNLYGYVFSWMIDTDDTEEEEEE